MRMFDFVRSEISFTKRALFVFVVIDCVFFVFVVVVVRNKTTMANRGGGGQCFVVILYLQKSEPCKNMLKCI